MIPASVLLAVMGVALVAVTVWYVARPLRRTVGSAGREMYHQLISVRERLLAQLNELDMEAGDRNIDAATVADERARIEAELAQVLNELERHPPPSDDADALAGRSSAWAATITVIAIAVPVVAAGLYGATNYTTLAKVSEPVPASGEMPPMVMEMVGRLEERLRQEPNDPLGWAKLGRAYRVLGRWDESKEAYARAYALAPDNLEVISAYAGALIAETPAAPSPQAVALFQKLHKLEPNNPGALWVLGLVAFNNKEFRQASRHWERLLKVLPPDSGIEPQVRKAIEAAREQGRGKGKKS